MRAPGVDLECIIDRPVAGFEAKASKRAGIDGRTHEQILMDRLEAHAYKGGCVIEISAKRLRHSMQTAMRHYADLRTKPRSEGCPGGWETPLIKVKNSGV